MQDTTVARHLTMIVSSRWRWAILLPLVLIACATTGDPAIAPTTTSTPVVAETRTASAAEAPPEDENLDLPRVARLLSTEYQEAYRLLPNGAWAERYYAAAFNPDEFDWEAWESGSAHVAPSAIPEPHIDAGLEFELTRVLRDEDEREWLIGRIRELDASSAAAFEQADSEAEQLDVFRQMLHAPGIDVYTLGVEIIGVWLYRGQRINQEDINRYLAHERQFFDTKRAVDEIWLSDGYNAMIMRRTELRICEHLMWDVLDRHDLWVVISDGQCDIERVTRLSREELRAGPPAMTEEDYRELARTREELRERDASATGEAALGRDE